jgi:hypothetical protein
MNKNKMVTKKDTSAMFMSKVIALTNYNMTPEYLEEILRSEPNNRVCKEVRRIAKLNNNDLVNLYENALTIRNAEAKKTEVPAVEETLPIEYLVDHQCAIDAIKVANKRIAELESHCADFAKERSILEEMLDEKDLTIDRTENCANNYKMWYNESEEKLGKAFQRIGGLQYLLSEMQKGRKDKGLELVVKEALKDMPK